MKLVKIVAVATALTLSLTSLPTSAVCLGMACMYNKMTPLEAINATVAQVDEALNAIKIRNSGGAAGTDKENDELIITEIKEALKLSKEINANDKLDRNRNRANDYLKKARESVLAGDLPKATEQLKEAEQRFSALTTMLELTQADRASQQTHLLNRILNTEDKAAGARNSK